MPKRNDQTTYAYTFRARVYASPDGYRRLEQILGSERWYYNQLLAERRDAWEDGQQRIGLKEQSASLTQRRKDDPFLGKYSRRINCGTLDRLDRAFQSFFRRVKAGETPGYPRFKGADRFRTLEMTPDWVKGPNDKSVAPRAGQGWFKISRRIQIPGLPTLRLRQDLPDGEILYMRLTRKKRAWYVSLSIRPDAETVGHWRLPPMPAAVGIDLGITDRARTSDNAAYTRIEDDRKAARRAQRKMSRRRKAGGGRPASKGYRAAVAELRRVKAKDARRRQDANHKISRELVNSYGVIAVEKLAVARMTKSAAGTVEQPGRNVAAKRGLNRSILEQGWSQLRTMLRYKAEWAGRQFVQVNPAHTSQSCSVCGVIDKASRRGKVFSCRACGVVIDADWNAAINIIRRGLAMLEDAGLVIRPGAYQCGSGRTSPKKLRTQRGLPPAPTSRAIQGALLLKG